MMAASRKMLLQGLLVVATIFVPSKTPYAGTCYWDRSAPNNRGLLYSGSTQPMSVSVFDFNGPQGRGDGVLDVQIHFRFGPARLYRGQVNSDGLPQWFDATLSAFGPGNEPPALAGPATAGDYDNDGRIDLLIARYEAQSNMLFHNQGNATFVDVANNAGLNASPDYSFLYAAWGDHDGDGWVDIAMSQQAAISGCLPGCRNPIVFRNLGAGQIGLFQEQVGLLPPGNQPIAAPGGVAWMDVNSDGKLDLIALESSGGFAQPPQPGSNLWINLGGDPPVFQEVGVAWGVANAKGASFLTYGEIFKDGLYRPDLVVTGFDGIAAGLNSGASFTSPALACCGDQALVYDFNLDGKEDILAFSQLIGHGNAQQNAVLFRNNPIGVQEVTVWEDVAPQSLVHAEGVAAGAAADFEGDGDYDLLQADEQPTYNKMYFEAFAPEICGDPPYGPDGPCPPGDPNLPNDDPARTWLRLKLQGHVYDPVEAVSRVTNADLIGTRVVLEELESAKWVQGSWGTASGASMPLLFGTDELVGGVHFTIRWPNGVQTTDGPFMTNQAITIEDKSVPYVKDSTVECSKTFGPNIVSLQFFWRGVGHATTANVKLTHTPDSPGGDCYDYVATLTPQSENCSFSQTKVGANEYLCFFAANSLPCHPNCRFDYVIEADNGVAKASSHTHTVRIASCIGG